MTLARIGVCLLEDVVRWLVLLARSTESVRAENLVLRRQLAMFLERGVRPHRPDAVTRVSLAVLARLFELAPCADLGDQRWSTFLKNHAKAILACDFFVVVTATFRRL